MLWLKGLRRTNDQLTAFHEIAKALTSTLDAHEVLELVMQKVSELLGPSNWSLLLHDERTDKLYFEIAVGPAADVLKPLRLNPGEGIAGRVFEEGVPKLVQDVREEPAFAQRFDELARFQTRSIIAVPLQSKGRKLGVIELVNGPEDRSFDEADLQTLLAIGDYAAIAIENARNFRRVQELTLTDEHTGLYNARHLRALLDAEIARSARFHHPLSLVFLDLDRFKQVNDTHGHLVGSALLKEVGGMLKESIRQVDSAFRYGGDEFAIVLIETGVDGAKHIAERILQRFREQSFQVTDELRLQLTASMGVATFPDHAHSARSLLDSADRAMYRVKASGRNGMALASEVAVQAVPGQATSGTGG